ncbi:MAG: outer membrane beta-barrel protein [Bacteroidia bacterium]
MKKQLIITALVYLFTLHLAHAQIGVQGGMVGVFGESFPTADGLDKLGGAKGFTVGVFYNVEIAENLSVQPAINWLNKTWKDELDETEFTRMVVNYLEVPVQLVYTAGEDKGFFVGAGPSFWVGMSGTRTVTIAADTQNSGYALGAPDQEGRFTLGVNAMLGYALEKVVFSVNYGQGLTNQPDEAQNFGNKNHLALRLGVRLSQ